MPATQIARDVAVKTALADDVLLFASMRGVEELGRMSSFTVSLLSTDSEIAVGDVLGKRLGVILDTDGQGGKRHFQGIVTGFASTGAKGDFASYEATVHPSVWLLSRSSDCRIFQDMTVPDIVKQVCSKYGGAIALSLGALSGDYPSLTYCVQYRETDLDFIWRLMEGAGIYCYFIHDESKDTMVLADSSGAHQAIAGYDSLRFAQDGRIAGLFEETVKAWTSGGAIAATTYVLNDFDFQKAGSSCNGALVVRANIQAAVGQDSYEMYDYPGNYSTATEGDALARGHLERLHGQSERITAVTDARGLYPGGLFTLAEHPRDSYNSDYLVTRASYEVTGIGYNSGSVERGLAVVCEIEAIGKQYPYRPLAKTKKPVMQGPQTAIVVGKAGEEIWTDKYGRVKVQFHWDRLGKQDENSSCWVRVAQGWAGKNWGAFTLPRVGMEVVVSFLEGDPDRPLVTGCVYNGDALPPYALPADQTRSTIKSRSTKDGDGFNELRFEDKKGAEEVFMHAERDFLRVVKNNDALKVGFDTADKGDQSIDIKNDQTITIGHDQIEKIDNNQTLTVKVDQKVDVGSTIVIEAGTSIELKVGGSSIKIEAAKITIKSAEIEIAADANVKVKAGAMMEVKSGAVMTIGGALVQIN